MQLSQEEADILREYLQRGGFFVVDDFHGTYEWANFEEQIRKVFPTCKIEEIPLSHPVFHCFFDVEALTQVPGAQTLYSGVTYEKDGYDAHYRGIFRRHRASDGDDQFQLRFGRCVGVGRRPVLSGEVFIDSLPPGDQLHHLFDDALRRWRIELEVVGEKTCPDCMVKACSKND
jgi:hypothetical protein